MFQAGNGRSEGIGNCVPTKNQWHPYVPPVGAGRMRKILSSRGQWTWSVLLAILLFCPITWAQDSVEPDDVNPQQMQIGSLLLRMKSGYVTATRMNTAIAADINGMVARVSVRQTFRNSGPDWVEGVYVFPLPDSAAVDRLQMHIGERFIEAEIREKEQAKKEYEVAKTEGKKASIVEQQRANLFTTSVANIAPGETVTIEIQYLETVRYEEEIFSLRFPVTLTPRYIPGSPLPGRQGSGWSADTNRVTDASMITPPYVSKSGDHQLSFVATINAGTPLDIIASRYHPVRISEGQDQYTVELSDPAVSMDHDLELTWRPVPAAAPRAMLFTETVFDKPHLLLMMLPPSQGLAPSIDIPRELIFVIDTSGSMHGTSLGQAKRALSLALDGLKPADRFNVIQFNSVTTALFPAVVDADSNSVGIAKRFVAGLSANGGTEMRPAIEQALLSNHSGSHLRQVIFITDGSVGNEQELFGLIQNQLGNSRLFTVGIGSAPNSWFMRKAAEAGRGSFTSISALHEVSEKMDRLFRKLEQPQITDIAIQWPGGQVPLSFPETVPDLYAGEPILVKARLNSELLAGDVISVAGNSVSGPWGAQLSIAGRKEGRGIASLWARSRIENLLDKERRGANKEETRQAVTEIALEHHLVSKFTSLVAVDKTPVRSQSDELSKEQVANLMPYGQSHQRIFGFPATATPAEWYRLSGLVLIIISLILMLPLLPGSFHREFAREL